MTNLLERARVLQVVHPVRGGRVRGRLGRGLARVGGLVVRPVGLRGLRLARLRLLRLRVRRALARVLVVAAAGRQWLSFNAREDFLRGLTVGTAIQVTRAGATETIPAAVTELRPLGVFAAWQAERAVGDHDRNTLRLRLDPQRDTRGLEPGMTVWIVR